jgi:hypothetical protein
MSSDASAETHRRLLRAWQLMVLRYAVTLDDADRQNVLALAGEIDRSADGSREATLHFFRRTSTKLCSAVLEQRDDADAVLQRFFVEIDDPRLKRAFAAAVGIAPAEAIPTRRRSKPGNNLFSGLPSRKAHA